MSNLIGAILVFVAAKLMPLVSCRLWANTNEPEHTVVLTGVRSGDELDLFTSATVNRLNGKDWNLPNKAKHFESRSWPTGNVFEKSIPKSCKFAAVRRSTPPQYNCGSVVSWRRPWWPDEPLAQVAISNRRSNFDIAGPFLPPSPMGTARILDNT